jgi:hypothetical protein
MILTSIVVFLLIVNESSSFRCQILHHSKNIEKITSSPKLYAKNTRTREDGRERTLIQSPSQAHWISRGALVWLCSASAASLLSFSSSLPVHAAIPSMDEFYQTSGTKIVDKAAVKTTAKLQTYSSADLSTNFFDSLETSLQSMSSFIGIQDWDSVLRVLAQYKIINKAYFDLDSQASLASRLGMSISSAKDLEGLREDLSFDLGQLDEYARSHRIIYFNKEDMKIVKVMTTGDENADTPVAIRPEDSDDATAVLTSARAQVSKIRQLISSSK